MAKYADKPENVYEVKALAERLIPQLRLVADPGETAESFFNEHEKHNWWLNEAPIRSWKKLFEGKLKRMREQERGKVQPHYHRLRFAVCDVCWDVMRNHDIEGLRECGCVLRCVKKGNDLMYLLNENCKPSKILMAIYKGKMEGIMDDDDVETVEAYYRASRIHYLTVYNKTPDALEVYEHIRHLHDRILRAGSEEYHARVQPFKDLLLKREMEMESGGKNDVSDQ